MTRKDTLRISEEAAEWLEALASVGGKEKRAEFAAWLRASPRHVEELLMMQALDREAARFDTAKQIDVQKLLTESGANVRTLPHFPAFRREDKMGSYRWRWAAGIAFLGVMLAIGWRVSSIVTGTQKFATAIGEQRAFELEDGSIIHLNAYSRVDVHLSAKERAVRLLEGEALFKVAHDATRPFRVYSDDMVIRAVGTQFNVYRLSNGITTVSVLEGRVEIARTGTPAFPPRKLTAGEIARISPTGRITEPTHVDTAEATAWRQRRLVFRDSTLGDIAAEFNRYNRTPQITVEGDTLRARRYGGTFDADDPESLVDFLRPDENLQIDRVGSILIIRSRPLNKVKTE